MTKKSPPIEEKYSRAKHLLSTTASFKQDIYSHSFVSFEEMKKLSITVVDDLRKYIEKKDDRIEVSFKDINKNEYWIKFGGDILVFSLHTNVFSFDKSHAMYNSAYVQEDISRAYFSMIEVYNFLSDSVTYNRLRDVGEMLGRIFINADNHFFIEGIGAIGSLYYDLPNLEFDDKNIESILENFIVSSIDYDLWAPPFQQARFIPLMNIVEQNGNSPRNISKRLGFNIKGLNESQ